LPSPAARITIASGLAAAPRSAPEGVRAGER